MACVHKNTLSSFDFALIDICPLPDIAVVAMVTFLYAWISQDISRGIDTMWPFLGLHHLMTIRFMKLVGFTIIPISTCICVYDACICTDCMDMAEFPLFHHLVAQKFRLWVRDASTIGITKGILSSPHYDAIIAPLRKLVGGKANLINFLHNAGVQPWHLELIEVIEFMASKKLLLYAKDNIELLRCLGKVDKFIQKKIYICLALDLLVDVALPVTLPVGVSVLDYICLGLCICRRGWHGCYLKPPKWDCTCTENLLCFICATGKRPVCR